MCIYCLYIKALTTSTNKSIQLHIKLIQILLQQLILTSLLIQSCLLQWQRQHNKHNVILCDSDNLRTVYHIDYNKLDRKLSNCAMTWNTTNNMKQVINIPPCMSFCWIVVASDLFWIGSSSITLMMFLQVVGVGWLLSQLWNVIDNFTWSEKVLVSKPLRVFSSTPSWSPISYHL